MSSNSTYRRIAKAAQYLELDDAGAVICSEENRKSVGPGALLCGAVEKEKITVEKKTRMKIEKEKSEEKVKTDIE